MAKVEMSLSEYNAIKEELDFLHRVVKEITTTRRCTKSMKCISIFSMILSSSSVSSSVLASTQFEKENVYYETHQDY